MSKKLGWVQGDVDGLMVATSDISSRIYCMYI